MENKKIAIVTGSNKGIGFEIVKVLCKDFDGNVYLTCKFFNINLYLRKWNINYLNYLIARNVDYGKKAIEELKKLVLEAKYHQLDIQNLESINMFAAYIKENYGGIDVLVNNAAIALMIYVTFKFQYLEIAYKRSYGFTVVI